MKPTTTWLDQLGQSRLENEFVDFKPPLSKVEAEIEASRCINCYDAPCVHACPTAINIPQFISRIANGNTIGAAKTILSANIMGLSCAHACPTDVLCEGACVFKSLNKKPIEIGKLQRYAVERAYENNETFFEAGSPSGKRVALVGAGPASLSCAHELRKLGHEAVIFEKSEIPGGLNTSGIAPYKMKAEVSLREIEQIAKLGARFEFGHELGRNIDLPSLLERFDAVFLGIGLGPDSRLDCLGSDLPQIQGAVDFIARLKVAPKDRLDWIKTIKTALVVGGGNTAIDACRVLKNLGVPSVIVSYRRGESEMSGYAHELKLARQEGVDFWFNTLPVRYERSGDELRATIQRTAIDSSGRVRLLEERIILECGLSLVATGQSKLEKVLSGVEGLIFDRGRLKTGHSTGRTGHVKIYAGGDLANGGLEVVNAVAEGKRAALGIHAAFSGVNHG